MQDRRARAALAAAHLHNQARIVAGTPPVRLPDAVKRTPTYEISDEAFLLRVPTGLTLYYRRGEGVTASYTTDIHQSEIGLFLNGSVYGAIAWLNGFLPLHASAVASSDCVHAFTAPCGHGKSTLAAALDRRGMEIFSDDVLVLDLSEPDDIICLPGHRHMKLWDDAVKLTGAKQGTAVRRDMAKYYVSPRSDGARVPLPLAKLTFLQSRAREPQTPVALKGAERINYLLSALYRRHFCAAIVEHRATFAMLTRIAAAIPMVVFDRPLDKAVFNRGVELVAASIAEPRHG